MERRRRELLRKRRAVAAQIDILKAQLASDEAEVDLLNREDAAREDQLAADRVAMGVSRRTGPAPNKPATEPDRKPKKRLDSK
jgi:circadian clock protein KaiC